MNIILLIDDSEPTHFLFILFSLQKHFFIAFSHTTNAMQLSYNSIAFAVQEQCYYTLKALL